MVTLPVNSAAVTPAPRGTRPKDRRGQIRAAATRLFYERGYEQVSMADIAESVNVGPSALYRHFAGKSDILFEAIDGTATAFGSMLTGLPTDDGDGIALACARTALAYRRLGVLWQREGRYLPQAQRVELRTRLRTAGSALADTLGTIRPDLDRARCEFLAACLVNAMSSISFHRLQLAQERYEELLAELAQRIVLHSFDTGRTEQRPLFTHVRPVGRREEIAEAATVLFARHGFESVSIDDLGAAVGIAGPSIYNHFASKQAVLFTALARGYAELQRTLIEALAASADPAVALRRVSASYVGLALGHSHVITTLIAEARNLDPEYSELTQRAQLDYIGRWVALIQEIRPDEDLTVSRIKVQAAQMLANSLGRTSYLQQRPGFEADVAEICWGLLQ